MINYREFFKFFFLEAEFNMNLEDVVLYWLIIKGSSYQRKGQANYF